MSKQSLLEEFDKEFVDRISGDMWQTTSREKIKQFLSKAIDQTRQETIKEVEEILPEEKNQTGRLGYQGMLMGIVSFESPGEKEWNECLNQIKQSLNNLKQ